MKKLSILLFLFFVHFFIPKSIAQDIADRPIIAVLQVDSKGFTISPVQMGNIVRTELTKLDKYQVMDRYDVDYVMNKNEFSMDNCFGKTCMIEAGKILKTDKMLTGSVEVFSENIVVTLRLIDVGTESIQKTQIMDFLNLRSQIQVMVGITMKKMFDEPVDENMLTKLTKKFDYESTVNYPEVNQLSLDGPRMGLTFFTGELNSIYGASPDKGGFDALPLMFQFGYQFEIKYLNQGDFQALFEFIPIITGLDQGKFIPSISFLNGMRSNRTGLEFAFGPIFFLSKKASGYYDDENVWHLENEWVEENPGEANPFFIEKRLDSRGEVMLNSGFVFAAGKTFKSGRLNIPINAFFIPDKDGHRFGISLGFNSSRYNKQ